LSQFDSDEWFMSSPTTAFCLDVVLSAKNLVISAFEAWGASSPSIVLSGLPILRTGLAVFLFSFGGPVLLLSFAVVPTTTAVGIFAVGVFAIGVFIVAFLGDGWDPLLYCILSDAPFIFSNIFAHRVRHCETDLVPIARATAGQFCVGLSGT
jgi:hypothetical protein